MFIPRPAYEVLPYAYIGGGLFCGLVLGPGASMLPAFMLGSAGLIVLLWRTGARRRQRRRERVRRACRDLERRHG